MPTEFLLEVFRNKGALEQYLVGTLPEPDQIDRHIYVGVRERYRSRPDYAIKNLQQHTLGSANSIRDLLTKTFSQLSDTYLEQRANEPISVKGNKFSEWQNIITEISPLSIVSWHLLTYQNKVALDKRQATQFAKKFIVPQIRHSALPTVFEPRLDELIKKRGLDDIHIHLNGSTEVELIWRDALSHPSKFSSQFKGGGNRLSVLELFQQEGTNLTHEKLLDRLSTAINLRFTLYKCITESEFQFHNLKRVLTTSGRLSEARSWNIEDEFRDVPDLTPLQREALFLAFAFDHLKSNPSEKFSHALYAYLLISAQFFRLLVHQTEQKGFDQFQKITENEIREMSEKDYEHRYHQLDYSIGGDIDVLEGRFAPSKDNQKNQLRLRSMLEGYVSYKQAKLTHGTDQHKLNPKKLTMSELLGAVGGLTGRMHLSLVAHFIKKPDKLLAKLVSGNSKSPTWLCRHYALRQELDETSRRIAALMDKDNLLPKILSGFDAAANELHASPEVFAPIFRRLRYRKNSNFTFHAGEDFVHVLSGIRYVYEAIIFLEMGKGNRIGHGTAVGIDPELWRNRIGDTVVMTKGARLDDLVFAYHHLTRMGQEDYNQNLLPKIEEEIKSLCVDIYGDPYQPDLLYKAWMLRSLDPIVAFELDRPRKAYLRDEICEEILKIKEAEACQEVPFKIFKQYHESNIVAKSEALLKIDKSSPTENLFGPREYRLLQKCVINEINTRHMAIEVLPTSNLRISFYKTIDEHHIFTWLGLDKEPGMKVTVCLGSDDPGIFSTNLRNEYAHILLALDRRPGHPPKETGKILEQLIKDGKKFLFHRPNKYKIVPSIELHFSKSNRTSSKSQDPSKNRKL